MLFRRPEWDLPMPDALVAYWSAWNAPDLDQVPILLTRAVTDDVVWNDPRDSFIGIDALEAAIRRLRTDRPGYSFVIVSEVDGHHDRLRYRWDMMSRGRVLMEGLDVVTIEATSGLIARVDGFFGYPSSIKQVDSGVPADLRGTPG